jgi:hypothetical protein
MLPAFYANLDPSRLPDEDHFDRVVITRDEERHLQGISLFGGSPRD